MVLVHHAGYDADIIAVETGRKPLSLDADFDWGFGIHLFFVLSGFIMVYAERDFGRTGAPWRFLKRRIIRVVPLYWVMTTTLLLGAWVAPTLLNSPVDGWESVLGSYLFIPVMRAAGDSHPTLGQGWTLNYEMMFYLLFAVAMTWPRHIGLLALACIFLLFVAVGYAIHPRTAALQVWTDPLLFEFLFGVGVATLYAQGLRLQGITAGLVALAGLGMAVAFGPAFGLGDRGPLWLLQGGPAALILAGFALGPAWNPTPLVLGLSALGDASYSLYLSHPFAIRSLRVIWLRVGGGHAPVVVYLVTTCCFAVAVSLMLFRLVERPLTHHLRSWSNKSA